MITSGLALKLYPQQAIAGIIIKNRGMKFCFQSAGCLALATLLLPAVAPASSVEQSAGKQAARVRSVVRADKKTGRLVRVFIATPKAVSVEPAAQRTQAGGVSAGSNASVAEMVEAVSKKYDVDPLLVHSVISVESAYDSRAVSHKGAQGLMQLMPETARRFGVKNSFDPLDNLEGGVRYLKYLDSLFPNDMTLKLAAYNAGEGAVWKYNNRVPPYRETREYVDKVGTRYGKAVRDASRRSASKEAAESTLPALAAENQYAHVESFVDSDGRLHLRTAESRNPHGSDSVSTP
jgi:soluble lytic murein transglycosylase-like protein